MRGDEEAAWPLIEGCLGEARSAGLLLGECQALGLLAGKAEQADDLELGLELALESAVRAHEADWIWWEAGQLHSAAVIERKRGNLDASRAHAARSLELSLALGDRRNVVFAAAELAVLAGLEDDARRAGLLWAAIETELARSPIGQWDGYRRRLGALPRISDQDAYAEAAADGALLTVEQAAARR